MENMAKKNIKISEKEFQELTDHSKINFHFTLTDEERAESEKELQELLKNDISDQEIENLLKQIRDEDLKIDYCDLSMIEPFDLPEIEPFEIPEIDLYDLPEIVLNLEDEDLKKEVSEILEKSKMIEKELKELL